MENERKMQNYENKMKKKTEIETATKGYYKISKRQKEVKKRCRSNF